MIEISDVQFNGIIDYAVTSKPITEETIQLCANNPLKTFVGQPNGGEKLTPNTTYAVKGIVSGEVDFIEIIFSKDNWISHQNIFQGYPFNSPKLRVENIADPHTELNRFNLSPSQIEELSNSGPVSSISFDWDVPQVNSIQSTIQIIVYDASGNSFAYDISDGFFTITSNCPTPNAPTLYDPSVSDNNYTISWSAVSGADGYVLQEDTDSSFTSPTEYDLTQTSKYFSSMPQNIYYYRVCAINDCGRGSWSSTKSVYIAGRQWPGPITDRLPSNGATNQPRTVTLSWNCSHPTGESMVYDVWFSSGDEYFQTGELVSAGQSGKTYVAYNLPYDTTCYWKIEARDETGDVRTSDTYHFTTLGDSTAPTGSVSINNGATTTDTLSVTLYLSASDSGSGVQYMRASNDGANWSYWQYYSSIWPAWNLGDSRYGGTYKAEGTFTAYVQFRDYEENVSATYSDSITKITGTPGDIILNGESYPTIQDAIDAADYGETVYLTEGTYNYNGSDKPPRYPGTSVGLVMKPGVKLIGAGAKKTKLEAEWSLYALIDADDCVIQGLTITNIADVQAGRYSVLMESSNSKLLDCILNTSSSYNTGVLVYNGHNNEISNNLAIGNQYGIKVEKGENTKIYNNTVVNNSLWGIYNNTGTYAINSIIKNNISVGNYYGVRLNSATFTHNDVWGNTYPRDF